MLAELLPMPYVWVDLYPQDALVNVAGLVTELLCTTGRPGLSHGPSVRHERRTVRRVSGERGLRRRGTVRRQPMQTGLPV